MAHGYALRGHPSPCVHGRAAPAPPCRHHASAAAAAAAHLPTVSDPPHSPSSLPSPTNHSSRPCVGARPTTDPASVRAGSLAHSLRVSGNSRLLQRGVHLCPRKWPAPALPPTDGVLFSSSPLLLPVLAAARAEHGGAPAACGCAGLRRLPGGQLCSRTRPAAERRGLVPLLRPDALPVSRSGRSGTGRAALFRPSACWMATSQIASCAFTCGTIAVLPFYTLMVVAPNADLTKRTVESTAPYVLLGLLYAYLLYLSWTPDTLRAMFASKYWLPELPGIVRMFTSEMTVASAWIHLLAVDLFAARQVYHDGIKNKIETRHSVSLCLLFCPIGIVTHVLTKVLTGTSASRSQH